MTLGREGTWIQNLCFHIPLSHWIVTWKPILRMLLTLLGIEVRIWLFPLRWFLQGEEPRRPNSLENKHNQLLEGSMLKRKHHPECLTYIQLYFGEHGSITEQQFASFYEPVNRAPRPYCYSLWNCASFLVKESLMLYFIICKEEGMGNRGDRREKYSEGFWGQFL